MIMTQEEYLASVEKSKEEAHDETMWGKPARDITSQRACPCVMQCS